MDKPNYQAILLPLLAMTYLWELGSLGIPRVLLNLRSTDDSHFERDRLTDVDPWQRDVDACRQGVKVQSFRG